MLLGGWTLADFTPCKLPDQAAAAFTGATKNLIGATYEPILYVGSQVVAGMKYCIICKITPVTKDPIPTVAAVHIWEKVGVPEEEKYEITKVIDVLES